MRCSWRWRSDMRPRVRPAPLPYVLSIRVVSRRTPKSARSLCEPFQLFFLPEGKRVGTVRTGSWPTWAYGERQHESRAHTAGAPDEREGAYRFASARSSACSWDHSLGWAPRPKTKVRGKKFCAGGYFLGSVHIWMGRAFLGLGPGSGIKAAATGRQPEKSTKSRVVDESGCQKHSGPTGGAPQPRKLRRGCLRRLSPGRRN